MAKLKNLYNAIDTLEFPFHENKTEIKTGLVIKIENSINRNMSHYEERKKELMKQQKKKVWMEMYSELIEDLHKSLINVQSIQVMNSEPQKKAVDRLQNLLDKIQHPEKEDKDND
jgi:hypothetical protein